MPLQSNKKKKRRRNSDPPKLRRQRREAIDRSSAPKRRHTAGSKKKSGDAGLKQRESRTAKTPGIAKGKGSAEGLSPKRDKWYKGRNLYPSKDKDGNAIYLPRKSDATPSELRRGQFVKDVDVGKNAVKGAPKKDQLRGRNLYPTAEKDADGNPVYLPLEGDATPAERLKGQFVKSADTGGKAAIDGTPREDRTRGRNLYPTAEKDADGDPVYLPRESDATPAERLNGQFVKDFDAGKEATDGAPKKDKWFRARNLYPTAEKDADGNPVYLPRESDATPAELLNGQFVKDFDTGKDATDGAPREDRTRGRNLYPTAEKDADGNTIYLPQESDATPSERLKGQFVNDIDAGKEVIEVQPKNLKPKMDNGTEAGDQKRMLYPVTIKSDDPDERLKAVYRPRESKANTVENRNRLFVPDHLIKENPAERRRMERAAKMNEKRVGRSRSGAMDSTK